MEAGRLCCPMTELRGRQTKTAQWEYSEDSKLKNAAPQNVVLRVHRSVKDEVNESTSHQLSSFHIRVQVQGRYFWPITNNHEVWDNSLKELSGGTDHRSEPSNDRLLTLAFSPDKPEQMWQVCTDGFYSKTQLIRAEDE